MWEKLGLRIGGGGLFSRIQEVQASGVTSFAKAFALVGNVNIKSRR